MENGIKNITGLLDVQMSRVLLRKEDLNRHSSKRMVPTRGPPEPEKQSARAH